MAFPFLTVFIVFVVFLSIRYRTIDRRQKKRISDYWNRQEQAAHTPAKDLSNLPYIHIPDGLMPYGRLEDDDIISIENAIQEISKKPLLNLNGKDNAELKILYGTENFDYMLDVAENFDQLQMLLVDYAKALMEHQRYEDAIKVLEYGVFVGSDISTNYTLLGDCYLLRGKLAKIPELKSKLQQHHLLLEPSIIAYLDSLEEPKKNASEAPSEEASNEVSEES